MTVLRKARAGRLLPAGLLIGSVLFLNMLAPSPGQARTYWYEERHGDRITTNCLTVSVDGPERIAVTSNRRGRDVLVTDLKGIKTLRCFSQDRARGRSFKTVNRDGVLEIEIVENSRTNRITTGPLQEVWIQDVSLVPLLNFLPAAAPLKQCAVHESTGKFYYLNLQVDAEETLIIAGREVRTVRVVQTARGVPRSLWSARYWYRKSDSLLVREQAVFGGPGTPETTSVLVKEE